MPSRRKPSKLRPLKTLRIFCEGEKTEPNYIKGYLSSLSLQERKSVIEIEPTKKNTPIQLVEEAVRAKKSANSIDADEFWVVFDRESPAKHPDATHARAFELANRHGVAIALSNVCFEYWILLHFVDTEAPYQDFTDIRRNSLLNEHVKSICGCSYEKSSPLLFGAVRDKVAVARQRGARLNQRGQENAMVGKDKPYQINPYVGMVSLLKAIDDFG